MHGLLVIHWVLNCGSPGRARDLSMVGESLDVTLLSPLPFLGKTRKTKLCLRENCIFATPQRKLCAALFPTGCGFSSSVQMHLHCSGSLTEA